MGRVLRMELAVLVFAALALLPDPASAQQAIEAWVQRVGGPGQNVPRPGMVVDGSGNVIVTHAAYAGEPLPAYCDDWVTTKYSGAGVPLWTNRYDGPANSQDWPQATAVDASGNVFVTGSAWFTLNPGDYQHCTTIKYSPSGEVLWMRHVQAGSSGGTALAVDSRGDVIITCQSPWNGSEHDMVTMKYSSEGVVLWTKRYRGPGSTYDDPVALAVDAGDNVVLVGRSADRCATIKYSSSGVPLWTNLHSNLSLSGSPLKLDRSGNVLVTGAFYVPWGSPHDFLTLKYSSAGVPLWTNRYDGPAAGADWPYAVAVDASDNVYVTGGAEVSGSGSDYATIKYSSSGVPVWTNLYNGTGNSGGSASALAVDAGGNVIVTGSLGYQNSADSVLATIAYSNSGVPLWTSLYNGAGSYSDWPAAIATDAGGAVYLTGISATSSDFTSPPEIVTVKYVIPLVITRQPVSCMNSVGSTASFTLEVAGSAPFSYQWRKNGEDLADGGFVSGATTTNLLLANVQLADAGDYTVLVTNEWGTATSIVAQLTVTVPPNPGRFTNFSYSTVTGFSFVFRDGTLGQSYRIQTSAALAGDSWVDWQSFTYNGPVGLMDVSATGAERRFYRAITP